MRKKLDEREQAFCLYQARLQNQREAAIRAGWPPERAEEIGAGLMARAEIRRRVTLAEQIEEEPLKKQVRAGLQRLAFGGADDAVKLLFCGDDPPDPSRWDLFCVSEMKRGKNGVEVRLFDRFKALEALAALAEAEHQGADTLPFYKALLGGLNSSDSHGDDCI